MTFETLGLMPELLKSVADEGYTEPTPIQLQAIPLLLAGDDLLAGSQTGTGKTAGYALPTLQRLAKNPPQKAPRALILAPTRELAAQIGEDIKNYGKYLKLKHAVIFGGVNINPQIKNLQHGVDIVIATPGRLLDLYSQRAIDLSKIEILILDEADHMLDMGFIIDIKKILNVLPKKRQNLLFSATFSNEIKALADSLLNSPKRIEVVRHNTPAETVAQTVYPVDNKKKRALLSHLIKEGNWQQVLVFMRTKHGANRLALQLETDGIKSVAIHGNKSQGARTKALADFKAGTVRVLVATDIAARGLDIDQLPHVVNFELPNVPEDYVHRIGRTGRAGRSGEAISLVCIDEHKLLRSIESLLKRNIPTVVTPGFEPDPTIKAEPIPNGRNNFQRNNRDQHSHRGGRSNHRASNSHFRNSSNRGK